MKLEHFNISGPAALIKEVRDFYVDVIGLEDGYRPRTTAPGHWLYTGSQPVVHLAESDVHTNPVPPSYLDHIAFSCDDFAQMKQRLENAGIPFETNRVRSAGLRQIFLRDPAGIRLELNFFEGAGRSAGPNPDSRNN